MPEGFPPLPTGAIAVVAHAHPSVSKGGGEIAAYSLYEGLLRAGTDAIFIAHCAQKDRAKLSLASPREFAVFGDPLRYDHFYQLASPDIWRQLKTILHTQSVRFIFFQHFLGFGMNTLRALAAETTIPFTLTFHEFLAICNHHGQMVTRPARRLCPAATDLACATCYPEHTPAQFAARRRLIQSALRPATALITPSRFVAERLVAWGLPAEKFAVIENGLRAEPTPPPPRLPAAGRPFVFGYFGQITPFKGVDTLLTALDLLAKTPGIEQIFRLRVHGNLINQDDAFTARFDASFAAHPFATYAGPYDNADVQTLMAACDYILVPSTWWENSPVVIQEAYAAGRPVICSGIGGMAEKVPHRRTGLQIRPGDAADLARTLLEAADEALYQQLSAALPTPPGQVEMAQNYLALGARATATQPPKPAKRRAKL